MKIRSAAVAAMLERKGDAPYQTDKKKRVSGSSLGERIKKNRTPRSRAEQRNPEADSK